METVKQPDSGKRTGADMQEKNPHRQEKGIAGKFTHKLTKDNFLIMILVGVLLLVIVWPVEDKNKGSKTQSEQWDSGTGTMKLQSDAGDREADLPQADPEAELVSYAAMLERSLEELLATMEGVGRVRVMVTLEGSGVSIVEKDQNRNQSSSEETDSAGGNRKVTNTDSSEETVFDSSPGSGSPYVKQVLAPKVEGVAVSAQGGGNAKTVRNITEAIQALFGIEAHKIKIVKMIP